MERLIDVFEKANMKFIREEKNLILSGVSERTLCGALMSFLDTEVRKSIFSRYHVDVEYNRNNGRIKTIKNSREQIITINCDLIVHSRGEIVEQDNLLALEMKKSTARSSDKTKDKERLIALTKDNFDDVWSYDGKSLPKHVCRYKLGVYYEVNIPKRAVAIEYYRQGALFHKYKIGLGSVPEN